MRREAAIEALWRKGVLDFKLRSHQLDTINRFRAYQGRQFVINACRQTGKTYELSSLAIGSAIQEPQPIIYSTFSLKATKSILRPTFSEIFRDCPREIKPRLRIADGEYVFPNGSVITLAGLDEGRAELLRGRKAKLVIVDEGGFIDNLGYIVSSVLFPMTKTTDGKIIIASTPPPSPAHDFVKLARQAEAEGGYVHKTIYDDPSVTRAQIDELAKAAGGYDSVAFRREYLGEFLVDETRAVVPEFTDERAAALVVEHETPRHFYPVVAMDVGFHDFTAVLFGYYDFLEAKLVVQDEVVMRGQTMTTDVLAEHIKAKEKELWKTRKVFGRWSDTEPILLNELGVKHKVFFTPTAKDDKEAQVNNLRLWIKANKILISPKCKTLIHHLKTAIWAKSSSKSENVRRTYERTDDEGHFDCVDALVYMLRNIPIQKNPFPEMEGISIHTHQLSERPSVASALGRALEKAFKFGG